MDQNFENQNKIHQYLTDVLSSSEKTQFEKELSTNSNLEEELSFSKDLQLVLQNKELLAVNKEMNSVMASQSIEPDFSALEAMEKSITTVNKGNSTIWLWSGLLIIGIVVLSIFTYQNQWESTNNYSQYIEPHLHPFENILHIDGVTDELFQKGIAAYEVANYEQAITYLTQHQKDNFDGNVQFYLGLSQLFNNNLKEAVGTLERTVDNTVPPVQDAAQWYLALTYIRNNQIPAAKLVLENIQANLIYGEKASALLKKLNNN